MGVEACRAAELGKPLPEKVDAPLALITSDNVGQALATYPRPSSPTRTRSPTC